MLNLGRVSRVLGRWISGGDMARRKRIVPGHRDLIWLGRKDLTPFSFLDEGFGVVKYEGELLIFAPSESSRLQVSRHLDGLNRICKTSWSCVVIREPLDE